MEYLPYVGAGEFYLEYGDIDFTITAPSNLIIVGSGELLNPQDCYTAEQMKRWNAAKNSDKTVMIRSEKEVNDKNSRPKQATLLPGNLKFTIHRDVAWAASKAFVRMQQESICPAVKNQWPSVCTRLKANDRKGNDWQRSTEMVKGSIEHYSNKWFEYPYPAATNVAGIVGGMEYPGIVFCSYTCCRQQVYGV